MFEFMKIFYRIYPFLSGVDAMIISGEVLKHMRILNGEVRHIGLSDRHSDRHSDSHGDSHRD